MKRLLSALLISAVASSADAQTAIVTGEGWEAFMGVEYQGGDARFPKKLHGVIVLTDSSLAFRECPNIDCVVVRGRDPWGKREHFAIPLLSIQSSEVSSAVRGASAGARIMFGGLAGDRQQEFIGVVHETDTSAEAPVFRTRPTHAGALDAKIRFRLKKLGKELAP